MATSSAGKIFVAPHHSTEELERRSKAADDGIERGHLHIIWLLSRSAQFVAEVTGDTPTSKILWRYNGLAGLGDGRLDNPGAARLLDQVEELRASEPPPDGGPGARWRAGSPGGARCRPSAVSTTCVLTRQVPRPATPKARLSEQARFKKSSRSASSKAPKRRSRSKSGRSMNTA